MEKIICQGRGVNDGRAEVPVMLWQSRDAAYVIVEQRFQVCYGRAEVTIMLWQSGSASYIMAKGRCWL